MKTSTISCLAFILGGVVGTSLSAQTGGTSGTGTGTAGGTSATTGSGGTTGDGTGTASTTGTTSTNGISAGTGMTGGVNSAATGTSAAASSGIGSGGTTGVSTNTITIPGGATIPAATTGAIPTATTNEIPAPTTGALPAPTGAAMPTSATDPQLNRATVSADARALNTPSSTTNVTTADTARVSPGTAPIGPQPLSTETAGASSFHASPVRGADDPVLTPTGNLSNAASHPGEAIEIKPVHRMTVATPPPAPERETRTPSPGKDQVWVPGHYTNANGQWIWIKGVWSTPPQVGARWVEGSYDQATRQWTEGRWDFDNRSTSRTKTAR